MYGCFLSEKPAVNSFAPQSTSVFIPQLKREVTPILKNIHSDRLIYIVIGIITLSVTIFAYLNGFSNRVSFFSYMYTMPLVVMLTITIVGVGYFFLLAARREPRPILCYWNQIKKLVSYRSRICSAFVLLTAMSIFISSFSTMKSLIPLIHPFEYDHLFHDIDFWLLGGNEPWYLVHSIVDSPYLISAINYCYKIWFFLLWGTLSYFLLVSHSEVRSRYLLSWILCWTILGMIIAMILSCAGPAFTARLDVSNHDYDALMQLLHQHSSWLESQDSTGVMALKTQDALWQSYANGKEMLGSGISAMPSMHVSMAVLMTLGMNAVNRKLGLVFGIFAVIIFIGSFSLGWHYLVDGLVSAPVTVLIWVVSGRIVQRFDQEPEKLN